MSFEADAVVVGAGAVGLACAYALSRRGLAPIVIEREGAIGQGVSSRNSEVIHGGLHYPPGSLKARFCVEGRRLLYDFLAAHSVAHEKTGKLIVATEAAEIAALEALYTRGAENGVEGLRWVDGAEAMRLEPGLRAVAAIESVESGQLDSHGFLLALRGEVEAAGGAVALHTPFEHAAPAESGWRVRAGGETLTARTLILAAGLGAQAAAARVEGVSRADIPALHLGKGVYFSLRGRAPFRRLIYPPPIPGALGMHYRRDLGGQARFGPDLFFVEAEDYAVPIERMAGFEAAIRRFWPGLPDGALAPDYAGIRPKLHGPGEPQADFRLDGPERHGLAGLVLLFGIESPGLTSSLAIGEAVAARLGL